MKKSLLIMIFLYGSIFAFLQISKEASLITPIIEINEKQIVYQETSFYQQTIFPIILETKDTVENRVTNTTNEVVGNDFVFRTNLDENAKMQIMFNEENIYHGDIPSNIGPLLEKEGTYQFIITDEVNRSLVNYQKSTFEFALRVKKSINVIVNTEEVKRGSFIMLNVEHVKMSDSIRIETSLPERTKSYYIEDRLYIYYPILFDTKIGSYPLKVYNHDEVIGNFTINVLANNTLEEREISHFKGTISNSALEEYNAIVDELKTLGEEDKYWDTYFEWPVSGEIIKDFNDEITSQNEVALHQGIDIAQEKGTPIKSIAKGKVIYSGKTELLGNFVIIDHGHSLRSYYGHLESIHVQEDDVIDHSTIIGTVGTNNEQAFLHFAISLGETPIFLDPWTFLKK